MFYFSKSKKFCFAFTLWFFPLCSFALETVELQLRWHHQFQFAGYYAAVEQGFYRDIGLNVILTEGQPDKKPVTQVLKGQATYGVGNSEVLLNRLQGAPLVALAAVFQHSPSVLIARKDSNISSPHDLIAKKVMLMGKQVEGGHVDADFVAMLFNEDIDINKIDFIPSSYQVQDLIDGKIEVFNAYLSNEPYYLRQRNVEYSIINPRNYGVDFYSDILFTTETELTEHPQRVKAFREASLKGWRYALDHQEEIIDLVISQYTTEKKKEHLVFEAKIIKELVLPDVVDLGHMNPWRWQHMARTFIDAAMVDDDHFLEGFNYQQLMLQKQSKWIQIAKIAVLTSFVVIVILIVLILAYYKNKTRN
jgi:ABC-type nitrate/sulfonate/bicarbonate transport system substrate-binding protein